MMTEQEKQAVETLTRSFTRMETLYKVKCMEVEAREEEISRLKTENAALRERLEKAVELPCKIGDKVYEVHGKCDGKNCPYNGDYGQWRCSYGGKMNCNSFITVNKFCYSDIPRVGKTIFVTKKAAEARLKEIKEKKQ